ncbi:hypothetical protein BO82DRAFT_374189 [Aspergillus uvarum CBS 121591]|uniref:Dienelactone hydrolase domain-containing protein n=1 Tax=Aspergillus uvarum CBS 121591 TaxID=1448315 RepID=A0A319CCH8_9EURO|nr:hypothetical protein BO82DRAFT_374189 [Aspergillus uvarum CBS 121591]PYH82070.1 hypothetical protein BO82DRAFT_374189 [Aspergillus uvarum CBS 121591]
MDPGCCEPRSRLEGDHVGFETSLAGNKSYVFPNSRLIADFYAEEVNATVYFPDFFGGEVITAEMMDNPKTRAAFDTVAFMERHSKTIRFPEILKCATALKKQYEKVGAIGFCYGGWAVFQLAARGRNLLHCVSTAHPSFIDKQEILSLGVPTQILAPEHDHHLTPELKNYCNLSHGYATRYDKSDKYQKASFERAKRSGVNWFNFSLH